MEKGRKSFILYKTFYDATKELSLTDKGRLWDAVFEYQINGTEPDKKSPIKMAFNFIKMQLDLDNIKYEKTVQRNRENGKKGGRPTELEKPKKPSGFSGNPTKPKKPDNDDVDEDDDGDEDDKLNNFKNITPPQKIAAKAAEVNKPTKGLKSVGELMGDIPPEPKRDARQWWQVEAVGYKDRLKLPPKDIGTLFAYFKKNHHAAKAICEYLLEAPQPPANPMAAFLAEWKRRKLAA